MTTIPPRALSVIAGYARRLQRSDLPAEDLVQTGALGYVSALPNGPTELREIGYGVTAARNAMLNAIRSARLFGPADKDRERPVRGGDPEWLPGTIPTPAEAYESRETLGLIDRLPAPEAMVIRAHYVFGLDWAEIAHRLGMTGASTARLHRRCLDALGRHLRTRKPLVLETLMPARLRNLAELRARLGQETIPQTRGDRSAQRWVADDAVRVERRANRKGYRQQMGVLWCVCVRLAGTNATRTLRWDPVRERFDGYVKDVPRAVRQQVEARLKGMRAQQGEAAE